jgi:hypothetical protein
VVRSVVPMWCLLTIVLAANVVLGQEFSADAVNLNPGVKGGLSKVYVGKDKVRFEAQGRQGGPSVFIIDEARNKSIALMPERHMYMDYTQNQGLPLALNFWHPSDPNDACPQWKKLGAQLKKPTFGSCQKIGNDMVNGRTTIKYGGTSADGKVNYVWVDSKLSYVVKMKSPASGIVLRNIQEGPQPASLFEVPPGYTKFDVAGAMKQR